MHSREGRALFVYLEKCLKIAEIPSISTAFTGTIVFLTHHPPQTFTVNFPQ